LERRSGPPGFSLISASFAQHHVPDFLRGAGLFSEIGRKALLDPGSVTATATASSYFAHANDPQLWLKFAYFSVYGGFWFAGTLAFGFGLPLIYLAMRIGPPRLRALSRSPSTFFLFLFAWLGILLFLMMPNGAGVPADNYQFVNNLGNVRYGLGPIVLTEVLAFFVVSGVLPPLSGPLLLAGLACGARVQQFVTSAYFGRDLRVFLAATLVSTAICWAIYLASRSGQAKTVQDRDGGDYCAGCAVGAVHGTRNFLPGPEGGVAILVAGLRGLRPPSRQTDRPDL